MSQKISFLRIRLIIFFLGMIYVAIRQKDEALWCVQTMDELRRQRRKEEIMGQFMSETTKVSK